MNNLTFFTWSPTDKTQTDCCNLTCRLRFYRAILTLVSCSRHSKTNTENTSRHFQCLHLKQHPHQGNLKTQPYFTVRSAVHTNPLWKRSFSKTFLKPEEFKNDGLSFSCGRKTVWKRSFSKTMASRYSWDFTNPTNPKWPAIAVFLNSSNLVWMETFDAFSEWKRRLPISGVHVTQRNTAITKTVKGCVAFEWHLSIITAVVHQS